VPWPPIPLLSVLMDRNYAYLRIIGEGEIKEVTRALGVEPTKSWNKGDVRKAGGVYEFSNWTYNAQKFEDKVLDSSIEKVVDFLESLNWSQVLLPSGFEGTIQCVSYHKERSPGFHLDRKLISRIAELNMEVDFDLYCENETDR